MKQTAQGLLTAVSILFGSFTAQALEIGQKAPLFQAESQNGPVELVQILTEKNVVLAFYYADFTPV